MHMTLNNRTILWSLNSYGNLKVKGMWKVSSQGCRPFIISSECHALNSKILLSLDQIRTLFFNLVGTVNIHVNGAWCTFRGQSNSRWVYFQNSVLRFPKMCIMLWEGEMISESGQQTLYDILHHQHILLESLWGFSTKIYLGFHMGPDIEDD